jgi:SSS family solute:Na+ symporter
MGATSLVMGGWLGTIAHVYPSSMAQNFWTAIFAWSVCFGATVAISLATRSQKTDEQLRGLVWSMTPHRDSEEAALPAWKRVAPFGALVVALALLLNLVFW